MLLWNKMSFADRKKEISEEILKWSFTKESFLSVISVPYNSTKSFIQIIQHYVTENKNVIYITNEELGNINIIKNIEKHERIVDYAYVENSENFIECKLKICNFENAIRLKEKFKLIIYDDINSFSKYNKYEIFDLIDKLSCKDSKVIICSIQNIFKHSREIFMPVRKGIQIVEPRVISTRLDMNEDIPFVVYEYLRWSMDIGKKTIIYVPDEQKLQNVYLYVYKYCKNFSKNIITFFDGKSNEMLIKEFLHGVNDILITNSFHRNICSVKKCDIMVYFADNPQFDYKRFVYLCRGRDTGRGENSLKEEVILLANLESIHIEETKNITRNFNRKAWKMGLLKV
ncbi:hypothetical protein [Clostridium kluyveri]|uniref:Comf operon protein A, DNA transporter ATPase n=2 Tax=Clostridium kluyveri TaxID=1534 RepID=A5N3G3_CLOK5|nr:hypothetical protein [Clostridium kluyveri]EDK35659.1 Conserved hypothetical protein [Clostridium kluyveri DSM 555]